MDKTINQFKNQKHIMYGISRSQPIAKTLSNHCFVNNQ